MFRETFIDDDLPRIHGRFSPATVHLSLDGAEV